MPDGYTPLPDEPAEGEYGAGNREPVSSNFTLRNLDDLLSYQTQKVVVIRDRRLGCLYLFICAIIFFYFVIFQILFCNVHFPRKDVTGTSRVTIQQPTRSYCDPDNIGCHSDFQQLENLPYCQEYTLGEKRDHAKPCVFADRNSIAPNGMLEAHLLIPTQVASTVQAKGCEPSSQNGHSCENEYDINGTTQVAYVADIERYMLHISHSYARFDVEDEGQSESVHGYYLECDRAEDGGGLDPMRAVYGLGKMKCDGKIERKPIECLNENCPYLASDEDEKSLFQQAGRKASSLLLRGRMFGASLLTRAAESLYSRKEHSKHRSKSKTHDHGHEHQHRHQHRKKLVRIDAKGIIHTDTSSEGSHQQKGIIHTDTSSEGSHQQKDVAGVAKLYNASSGQALLEEAKHLKETKDNPGLREGGVWAEVAGDVFTVQKILDLCDLTLDDTRNHDGIPLREAGTVIEIEAYYSNLHPWVSTFGDTSVEYEYRVTRRPVEKFSNSVFSKYQPNFPAQRIIEERTGLYVIVKIGGRFGHFSLVYCLVLLASSAGLMRGAVFIVDKLALYCMMMKEVYNKAKYDYTERVYDMQKDLDLLLDMVNTDVPEDDTTPGNLAADITPRERSTTARASTADSVAGGD